MTGSYPVPHTKAVALFQQQLQWKTAFTLILWGILLNDAAISILF